MREYQVTISFSDSGIRKEIKFTKEVESLEGLKQAFLKRFGNIAKAPNKALNEKPLVKKLTHQAQSIDEWVAVVNTTERWKLDVK